MNAYGRFVLAAGVLALSSAAHAGSSPTPRVVGYFPDYEFARFDSIDLGALSHINYFSIAGNTDGSLSIANVTLSQLDSVVAAAHLRGVKVIITADPSTQFVPIGKNSTARGSFASNLVQFCASHALDGIDIDWEPDGPTDSDINSVALLIDALHSQTSSRGLVLTAAVNALNHYIPLSAIAELDWLLVMDYDIKLPDHADYDDAVSSINGWVSYGVPKNKLLMGVPFYGRNQSTSWSTTVAAKYGDIVNATHPGLSADVVSDPTTGNTWYYNGVNTISKKANYVLGNGFGGIMIWELGQDHFDTNGAYDSWSLLPAIKSVMGPQAAIPGIITGSSKVSMQKDGAHSYLSLSYLQFIASASLSYTVGVSDDLASWDWSGTQIEQVGSPAPTGDGVTEQMTVRLIAPIDALSGRKYLCLMISDP